MNRHPLATTPATRSACFVMAVAFAALTLAGIDQLALQQTQDVAALMAQHLPARLA